MKLVAIGGGDLAGGETLPLDQLAVQLTGSPSPQALFLPTASYDDPVYVDVFRTVYEGTLGCRVDALLLWEGYARAEIDETIERTKWEESPHAWESRIDPARIRSAIEAADLIYVGGGNTRRMMEMWRSCGVDGLLREASGRGAVLAGTSAGCICWGRYGNSDAALSEGLGVPTMRVDGLGLLPFAMCPHMSRESFRPEEFRRMMQGTPGVGIGLDDGCALHVSGDRYRFVASLPGAAGHRVTATETRRLAPSDELRPLADLLTEA